MYDYSLSLKGGLTMALFPKKNPIHLRKAFLEPGCVVYCNNCGCILSVGTDYNPSNPLCNRCYWI